MRSYSQNGEDVRLARAFSGQTTGFYVDVGAGGPVVDSVTRHFYGLGWHGINVEPDPGLFRLLEAERPRDVNLAVACSDAPGEGVLHETRPGLSTLDPGVAERVGGGAAAEVRLRTVPVTTLARICEERVAGGIDFLKIDVEAHEREVILGADWARWRPRVVVVEAVEPNSTVPSHASWEPLLLAADYLRAGFDGLNRFYVDAACRELAPCLEAPITPLDEVELDRHLREVERLRARLAEVEGEAHRRVAEIGDRLGERYDTSLRAPRPVVSAVRAGVRAVRAGRRPRAAD